jgi:hypothetical protein
VNSGDLVRTKRVPGWKRCINWLRVGRYAIVLERDYGGVKVMLSDGTVLCDLVENWEVISESQQGSGF